ncbi:MAG TPA: hypothetical protein VEA69_13770 [Tepidisphaeraceae bacterium]|nr:hypothetical protein [Tepidisphaeraceae bacterium]
MSVRSLCSPVALFLAAVVVVAVMPWFVTLVLAVAVGSVWAIVLHTPRAGDDRLRRMSAGLCAECGYDLTFAEGRCPECGAHYGLGWSHPAEAWECLRRERPAPVRPVSTRAAVTADDDELIPPT